MEQELQLMYGGYAALIPGLYFNRVLLISKYIENPDEKVKAVVMEHFNAMRPEGGQYVKIIQSANTIAGNFDVGTPPLPKFPNDYFEWATAFFKGFEEKFIFPTNQHFFLLFGKKTADAMLNIGLIKAALTLTADTNRKIDLRAEAQQWFNDLKQLPMLYMGAAQMLTRNTGKDCFFELGGLVMKKTEVLGNPVLVNMDDAACTKVLEELENLGADIGIGLKNCTEALK